MNVSAITWIRFIGSRQNLAWTYYLTLGTSLRKNFSFFSKSKMAAGGQKFATRYTYECFCNNLDPVHRIQTKFGMDILLDPRNKLVEEFFIFLKIQDGRRRSKIEFRHNFCSKFTFRLGICIRFIGFRQTLAWTYHLTLGTSLWKRFPFFSKSKMAASRQKLNLDIILAQRSHFGLANGSLPSDLDKIWQADTTQP